MAELLLDVLRQPVHLGRVAHVDTEALGTARNCNHLCTSGSEPVGNVLADAAAGTCNHRDGTFNATHSRHTAVVSS